MRTQKNDLKDEIKHLEIGLHKAEQDSDAITVFVISERLDVLKSTLLNID